MHTLMRCFLQFIQTRNLLEEMMPLAVIEPDSSDEFEKVDVEPEGKKKVHFASDSTKDSCKNKPWRILTFQDKKWVVGKELEETQGSKAKHTHDPLTCQHPSASMKARGGREAKWWCCLVCGRRWERLPLSSFERPNEAASGHHILTFGLHAGKTYDTVFKNHTQYCCWVLNTAESGDASCPALKRYASYIAAREARTPYPNRTPEDIPAGRMDEEL